MSSAKPRPIDVMRIAVAAEADPRTVQKFLRGKAVRGMVEDRIGRAVASLGLERFKSAAPVSAEQLKAAS